MTHDNALNLAIKFFATLEIIASPIDEGDERTADLHAADSDGATYFVEVKTKSHSNEMWSEVREKLSLNEVASTQETLHRTEAVADVLKYASSQLESTTRSADQFRIVWAGFDGFDQDLRWNQVLATFYGIVYVSTRGFSTPKSSADHCYYFDYSVAYSQPNIDALAICDGTNFQFCMNEFSPRYNLLKTTALYQRLIRLGAVLDPPELASQGLALLLRDGISRRDENAVAMALSRQEGAEYFPIRMNRHATNVSIQ